MWIWKTRLNAPKGVIVIVHGAGEGEYHGRYEWLKRQ